MPQVKCLAIKPALCDVNNTLYSLWDQCQLRQKGAKTCEPQKIDGRDPLIRFPPVHRNHRELGLTVHCGSAVKSDGLLGATGWVPSQRLPGESFFSNSPASRSCPPSPALPRLPPPPSRMKGTGTCLSTTWLCLPRPLLLDSSPASLWHIFCCCC